MIICGDLDLSERSRLSLLPGSDSLTGPRVRFDVTPVGPPEMCAPPGGDQDVSASESSPASLLQSWFYLIKSHTSFLCIYVVML